MLSYDLTTTNVANGDATDGPPTEGELQAILVALLLAEDCAFNELAGCRLILSEDNFDRISTIIRYQLAPLARDFRGDDFDRRLRDLAGLMVCGGAGPSRSRTSG